MSQKGKGFFTQTVIIRVLDDIKYAADKRCVTIAVFFNFKKAFDNIYHNKLID